MAQPPRKLGYSDVQTLARQAALAALSSGQGLAGAARAAMDSAESSLSTAITQNNLQQQIAAIQCGAGCDWCCRQMVGISVAEIALLEQAIQGLSQAVQEQTRKRIALVAQQAAGLTQAQWSERKIACPLLDDSGRCVVHAARPLPCRAMNSSSAQACQDAHRDAKAQIPVTAAPYRVYAHAQAGLVEALAAAGQSTTIIALGHALGG